MREDLINAVSDKFGVLQKGLLEKDIILHEILSRLTESEYFVNNYVFKGGTCLVKSYLGYYRFSEDLDFTWKDQSVFEGKSHNGIYKQSSLEAEKLGEIIEEISKEFGLEFKNEKGNTEYFQFGGGGKMLTIFVWYQSEIDNKRSMIKIQINFVEKIYYDSETRNLSSMIEGDESLKFLFENHPYLKVLSCSTYKPEEILCEKIRAILTRRGIKARDFLDIFLVMEKFGIRLEDIANNTIAKINYSTKMNEKYRNNLEEKLEQLNSGELFAWGEEKYLLLKDIDEDKFIEFEKELEKFLQEIIVPNLEK